MENVLLPLDLGDDSPLIAAMAPGLSALGAKRVVFAHVIEGAGREGTVDRAEEVEVRARLEEMAAPARRAGLETEVRVLDGNPAAAIGEFARGDGIDTVVCGSHGKSAVDSFLLGSVSEKLMTDGGLPTFMVRFDLLRNEADPADVPRRYATKLLLATDFSQPSGRAFEKLMGLKAVLKGSPVVFHVVEDDPTSEREADSRVEDSMQTLLERSKDSGVVSRGIMVPGDPSRQILAELHSGRMTGVVMGTRGLNAMEEALVGSVSKTVLRQASTAVLVVP